MIDPFSQMKRDYRTILDDADFASRINFVPSQSFYMILSGNALRETFLKVTNNEIL